jgi:hypothetical protein
MSNIAELRALEEGLMKEEDVKEEVSVKDVDFTLTDEEATRLIEQIKSLNVYEEMSDDEEEEYNDDQKKNIWTIMINKMRSLLSSDK